VDVIHFCRENLTNERDTCKKVVNWKTQKRPFSRLSLQHRSEFDAKRESEGENIKISFNDATFALFAFVIFPSQFSKEKRKTCEKASQKNFPESKRT
jgi:hypothetical protein